MVQAPALILSLVALATLQGCQLARPSAMRQRFGSVPTTERTSAPSAQPSMRALIHPILVKGCLRSLARSLDRERVAGASLGVLGVELVGGGAADAWPASLQWDLEAALARSGRFDDVVTAESDAILRDAGLRPESVRAVEGRRLFTAHARQVGLPLDLLLIPTLREHCRERGGALQRDHVLTLELVELATERSWSMSESVREEAAL